MLDDGSAKRQEHGAGRDILSLMVRESLLVIESILVVGCNTQESILETIYCFGDAMELID
jgi:hypothetical protein